MDFPALSMARPMPTFVCIDPALKYPNVSLITDAYVERLETIPSGKEITQVIVKRNGHAEFYKAASSSSPAGRSIPRRFCSLR